MHLAIFSTSHHAIQGSVFCANVCSQFLALHSIHTFVLTKRPSDQPRRRPRSDSPIRPRTLTTLLAPQIVVSLEPLGTRLAPCPLPSCFQHTSPEHCPWERRRSVLIQESIRHILPEKEGTPHHCRRNGSEENASTGCPRLVAQAVGAGLTTTRVI